MASPAVLGAERRAPATQPRRSSRPQSTDSRLLPLEFKTSSALGSATRPLRTQCWRRYVPSATRTLLRAQVINPPLHQLLFARPQALNAHEPTGEDWVMALLVTKPPDEVQADGMLLTASFDSTAKVWMRAPGGACHRAGAR